MAEAHLDGFAEGRHQAGVVCRDAGFEALDPLGVAEGVEIVIVEVVHVVLSDGADPLPLRSSNQPHAVSDHLADGVVAARSAEDEHDARQHVCLVQQLEEL